LGWRVYVYHAADSPSSRLSKKPPAARKDKRELVQSVTDTGYSTGSAESGAISRVKTNAKDILGRLIGCTVIVIAFTGESSACESLSRQRIGSTEVTAAEIIERGAFRVPFESRNSAATNAVLAGLPAFCRVEAVARPTADSSIGIEIWLPESGWNGMLLAVGNGAWAGTISYAALADALADGYAATSTDTGHVDNNVEFAVGHPEKLIDFAHRAVHEMAVAAKTVVQIHYSRSAEQAYFAGCSTGGRQALAAAQRYPADFDGIVAGAPAYYPTHIQGMQVWTAAINANQRGESLRQKEFDLLYEASLAACDARDSVADGVIEDPRVCKFDPETLICATDGASACLSPEQAETARLTYRGPVDDHGQVIFPGLARGSESGWRTLSGDRPLSLAFDTYAQLVFEDPDWDFRSFDANRDIPIGVDRIGELMDSADPDITGFVERGGKLLLYHGWSDPGIPAAGTIRYYDDVLHALGAATAANSVRLFMVPGMGHCRGGSGTDTFDPVHALDGWVRGGAAPERIEAGRLEGDEVVRTRPLCSYPKHAAYTGEGDTNVSANFECR
jgi:feruloyl esterase